METIMREIIKHLELARALSKGLLSSKELLKQEEAYSVFLSISACHEQMCQLLNNSVFGEQKQTPKKKFFKLEGEDIVECSEEEYNTIQEELDKAEESKVDEEEKYLSPDFEEEKMNAANDEEVNEIRQAELRWIDDYNASHWD